MNIFAKTIGIIEILIALLMAYLSVDILMGLFSNDQFAGEWGTIVLPVYLLVAASFGWAGYALLVMNHKPWLHQVIPAVAILLISAFLFWADNV